MKREKEGVSINWSVWGASLLGTLIFVTVGLLGGWAFQYPPNTDILNVLISNQNKTGNVMQVIVSISVYLFPIVVLLSSIPIYSIIIRYNLLQSGLCGKFWANVFAVLFPWVVSVPFYTGSGLINIISWVGLFVNGFINFVIPLLFYILAICRREKTMNNDDPSNLTEFPGEVAQFNAVPTLLARIIPPIWLAGFFALLTTAGIIGTIIIDIVYLALGNNLVS